MTITVRIGHFDTKMRTRVRHASADRGATQNVIVEVRDERGRTGYGEGCPREYVTGESQHSALAFLTTHAADCTNAAETLAGLKAWISAHASLIDENPAAFCALELALLDLLGRRANVPLETLIGAPPINNSARYTAVLSASGPLKTRVVTAAYRLWGFDDFKVKVEGDLQRDRDRLSTLPSRVRVRIDANNIWRDAGGAISHLHSLGREIWAVEEPLTAGDVAGMQSVAEEMGVQIILDESLTRVDQLEQYLASPPIWIANIRVSKCGGVLRSQSLAERCAALGFATVIGAQVGETSLLTRAALALGGGQAQRPLAREGAYGRILLIRDLVTPSVRFTRGARLDPSRFTFPNSPGLGLDIDAKSISWIA